MGPPPGARSGGCDKRLGERPARGVGVKRPPLGGGSGAARAEARAEHLKCLQSPELPIQKVPASISIEVYGIEPTAFSSITVAVFGIDSITYLVKSRLPPILA